MAAGTSWLTVREDGGRPRAVWRGRSELKRLRDDLYCALSDLPVAADSPVCRVSLHDEAGRVVTRDIAIAGHLLPRAVARDVFDWLCLALRAARPMRGSRVTRSGSRIVISNESYSQETFGFHIAAGDAAGLLGHLQDGGEYRSPRLDAEAYLDGSTLKSGNDKVFVRRATLAEIVMLAYEAEAGMNA